MVDYRSVRWLSALPIVCLVISTGCTPTEKDMTRPLEGPIYTDDQSSGVLDMVAAIQERKMAGKHDDSIELVYQPDYKTTPGKDPGGLVLLRMSWSPETIDKIGSPEANGYYLLERAKLIVNSGNGIKLLEAFCTPARVDQAKVFCNLTAPQAARKYIEANTGSHKYVVVRMNGKDEIRDPKDVLKY